MSSKMRRAGRRVARSPSEPATAAQVGENVMARSCKACGLTFNPYHGALYCSAECRNGARAPAVYRFICPDGRSYVGAVKDCRRRAERGIRRSNTRLLAAFKKHPPETFAYEVLEQLRPGCSERELREAEQRHIDRLRSWSPRAGFNIVPAVQDGDGPSHRIGKQFRQALIAKGHEIQRKHTAEWRDRTATVRATASAQ